MDSGFEQVLEGHQGSIFCLAQGGAYLFSGGEDMGVKTWQFSNDKFEPLTELKGHTHPIQQMKTTGSMLISADRGGTVVMWDLTAGQVVRTFATGHTNFVTALWVEESYLFTGALDGLIRVWDAEGNMQYEQVRRAPP